jgi:hypothetical protein
MWNRVKYMVTWEYLSMEQLSKRGRVVVVVGSYLAVKCCYSRCPNIVANKLWGTMVDIIL